MKEAKKRSYKRDIERAFRDCVWDLVVYGLLFIPFAGFIYLSFTDTILIEKLDIYLMSARFVAIFFSFLTLNGVFTAIARRIAATRITERSFYAVMLTEEQQRRIFRSLSGQVFISCLLTFFAVLIPASGFAAYEYYVNDNMSASVVAGIFSGIWLLICVFAYGFEVADLSSRDGFCTVSDRGIITAGKVYRFNAILGDVTRFVKKDNYYLLSFRRRSFFWIGISTRFPLPCAGRLSMELEGEDEQKVLAELLQPRRISPTEAQSPVPETAEEILFEETVSETEEEIITGQAALEDEIPAQTQTESGSAAEDEDKKTSNFNTAMFELAELQELMEQREEENTCPEKDEEAETPVTIPDVLTEPQTENGTNKSRMGSGTFLAGYILKVIAVLLIIAIAFGAFYVYRNGIPLWAQELIDTGETEEAEEIKETDDEPDSESDSTSDEETDPVPEEENERCTLWYAEDGAWYFTYEDKDILFVDNSHPLDAEYLTEDRTEPAQALDELLEGAQDDGIRLYVVRGYRSYDRQKIMYDNENRDEWVVPAGYSEHQSGYAYDLDMNGVEGTSQDLSFSETDAYSWLVQHCAEYGFILRYPEDKTEITGRCYEPWHFRYVGVKLASYLTENGLTLDEIVKDEETTAQ